MALYHDRDTEVTAWQLVDKLMELADSIENRDLNEAEFELCSEIQDDCYYWAGVNLAEGLTRDAVEDACESVWMALAYHQ